MAQKKNIESLSDEDLLKAILLEKENGFLGALLVVTPQLSEQVISLSDSIVERKTIITIR